MENSYTVLPHIIPVFIVCSIIYIGYTRYKNIQQFRSRGIQLLQAMRLLIAHIQKHRGLSSSIHSGDTFYRSQLTDIQHQVSRDFEHIAHIGQWVNKHPEWQGITQHWARLTSNVYTLPISSRFEQHGRLIKNIIVFIDDMTVEHKLDTLSHTNIKAWRELLTLSELIGQARGLGSSVAAHSVDTESSPLEGANKKLEQLGKSILSHLETKQCKSVLEGESLQHIINFLIYIDKSVLMENPAISSTAFFAKSTATLDILFDKMDDLLTEVHRLIT